VLLVVAISSCSGDEVIENLPIMPPVEVEEPEIIEIIRDLGGREIVIASSHAYLDSLDYEKIDRVSQQFNVIISEISIEHFNIIPTLQVNVAAGRHFADLVLLPGDMVFQAITGNLIYALEEFVRSSGEMWDSEFVGFHWTFAPYAINLEGAFLGVNMDIIRAANAENPLRLYEEGDWTFNKFEEILNLVTEYAYFGISGVPGEIIVHLIAANDGVLVYNYEYAYNDPRTVTALNLAYNIFQRDQTWQYNHGFHDWYGNFYAFMEGRSAFFPLSEWVLQQIELDFAYTIVPFPRGPDNESAYSFMRGFNMGLAIPRGTQNPEEVYTVLAAIFAEESKDKIREGERAKLTGLFSSDAELQRMLNILEGQGKFDLGSSVPAFYWMHNFLAEGFYSGQFNVGRAVELFRQPQQNILDKALEGWVLSP